MHSIIYIISICLLTSSGQTKKKKTNTAEHQTLPWRQEYEDELNNAVLDTWQSDNNTHSRAILKSNEEILDKIADSITSSEVFIKKVNGIDVKLNRLDNDVNEKTDQIVKYLNEILGTVDGSPRLKRIESILEDIRSQRECFNRNSGEIN